MTTMYMYLYLYIWNICRLGRNNEALQMLRDLILVDFADKLRAQAVQKEDSKYLRYKSQLSFFINCQRI